MLTRLLLAKHRNPGRITLYLCLLPKFCLQSYINFPPDLSGTWAYRPFFDIIVYVYMV